MVKYNYFALVMLSLASVSIAAPDFYLAMSKVNAVKANINYDSFCQVKKVGKSKTACQLKDMPSVGLMVCHKEDLDGLPCKFAINIELEALKQVAKAGIQTVGYFENMVEGIKCAKSNSKGCAAFLEEWLDSSLATFEHVSNYLKSNTAGTMARKVIGYTKSPAALKKTADDLQTILNFVGPQPGCSLHKQICDLQGFFLHDGGFKVMDPAGIEKDMRESDPCYDPDNFPTTKQVKDG